MREIKFRAWNKEHKKMFYNVQNTFHSFGDDDSCRYEEYHGFDGVLDDENNILMQYTGLKDKNGVEIYEGDIVRHLIPYEDSVGFSAEIIIIKWQTERFHDIEFNVPLGLGFNIEWEDDELVEVIGNVYENPELMKER